MDGWEGFGAAARRYEDYDDYLDSRYGDEEDEYALYAGEDDWRQEAEERMGHELEAAR